MNKSKAGKPATNKADLESATSNPSVVQVKATSVQKSTGKDELTDQEQELLVECESDINANLQGTFLLGYRLEQIRDQKLYRATHDTFALYCTKKWDFSKTHANRLIQAHLCEKHLKSVENVEVYVPTKESQVRYICDLKPEEQVKVASKVFEDIGDGEATAGDFGAAREELFPKPKREVKPDKKDAENEKPDEKVVPVKFDTKLVSFAKLHEQAVEAYNIHCDSSKRKELEKILYKIKQGLKEWVDSQAEQLNAQEAA
jgi:hypothetical protein